MLSIGNRARSGVGDGVIMTESAMDARVLTTIDQPLAGHRFFEDETKKKKGGEKECCAGGKTNRSWKKPFSLKNSALSLGKDTKKGG